MNARRASRGADHFQRLYDVDPDPWRFGSSKYEQAKYRRTIASLSSRRFRFGFEAGCSVGVLTRMLATHCDTLLAVDIVEAPLRAARSACADQSWVRFAQMQIPGQWPTATFDLIVLSEVLYFLSPADVARAADRVTDRHSAVVGGRAYATASTLGWAGQGTCTGRSAGGEGRDGHQGASDGRRGDAEGGEGVGRQHGAAGESGDGSCTKQLSVAVPLATVRVSVTDDLLQG